MQRLADQGVLREAILSSISQAVAGPFAFAEKYNEASGKYIGLVIENGMNTPVSITADSVIVRPEIAEANRPTPNEPKANQGAGGDDNKDKDPETKPDEPVSEKLPTRFQGTVTLSPDRPSKELGNIVEGIIEQLNMLEGAEVDLTLEIHAEVPSGLDKSKQRTLLENANHLNFKDRKIT